MLSVIASQLPQLLSSSGVSYGRSNGLEFIIPLVVLLGGAGAASGMVRSGGARIAGATLVLNQFLISRSPTDGTYISITGRPQGIMAFVLGLFGLAGDTVLRVKAERLTIEGSGLSGKFFDVAPLPNIASTHCGYSRNITFIFMSIASVLGGLFMGVNEGFGMFAVGLVVAALFYWGFVSSRTMRLAVVTNGSTTMGMKFRQGVIGGVSVDFAQVEECIRIINHLVAHASSPVMEPAVA